MLPSPIYGPDEQGKRWMGSATSAVDYFSMMSVLAIIVYLWLH
jgi:hypothetical protein